MTSTATPDTDHHPPGRLALACARRRCPEHRGAAHRSPVRPRHHHAQPQAAGDHRRAGVDYEARIQAAVPAGVEFEPLMTLYLTDNLPADEIARAKDAGVVAAKLYPAGRPPTAMPASLTSAEHYTTLEAMQKAGLLLLVHGEVTSSDIDLFDREAVFIDTQLIPLRRDFPN